MDLLWVIVKGKKSLQEQINCKWCTTPNRGTAKSEMAQIRRFEIETVTEEKAWTGTVQKLTREGEDLQANRLSPLYRIKQFIRPSDPAPSEAIQAGKDMVEAERKIKIAGPFTDLDQKNLFIRMGKLQTISKKPEEVQEETGGENLYPRVPGSYLIEVTEDITDRGDYLVIIESDSGNKLPMVVMRDKDGNPNRFVVPEGELINNGWKIKMKGVEPSLNDVILNNIVPLRSSDSVDAEEWGKVKMFYWNNESDRHYAITNELNGNDFDYEETNVIADVPNGDVSSLRIEQTK